MNCVKNIIFHKNKVQNLQLKVVSNLLQSVRRLSHRNVIRKRICIVGAGPAGFYAAQYILKHLVDCEVHVIEKLPVPFGLVRYGVAPDHPEVKNVINTFTKTAHHDRFQFMGNVCLGRDVTLQQLRDCYHSILLTYGANHDRLLNVPNENQNNVMAARDFVAWYNGLPGAESLNPQLNGTHDITIVGQGNVAIDVARMLLTPIDILRQTDTTEYALESLAHSRVERVNLIGRRGPLQAAFTIKELREMLKLNEVATLWRPEDFNGVAEQLTHLPRPRKRLTELMLKSLSEQKSSRNNHRSSKQFIPIFQRAPKQIWPDAIEFTVTRLENDAAILTDQTEKFQTDLILRSIGYKATCVDKSICFDNHTGRVNNINGRVCKMSAETSPEIGLYVAGWLGTGPVGVILTTMNTAFSVAKTICEDIENGIVNTREAKPELSLTDKRVVTWAGWQRIDLAETEAGKALGKPREKIVDIEKMLSIAGV